MLKYRIMTGGILLGMVAGMYRWSPAWVVALLVLALTSLAVLEVVDMLSHAGYPALKWTTLGVSLLWMIGAWASVADAGSYGSHLRWLLPGISAWAVFLGCLFRSDQSRSLEKLAGSFFTIAYVPGLMQFILLLLFLSPSEEDGRSLLLYGILVVKSTDMGAYFTGRAFGKHKLIPRISPAKTWEGVLGGVGVAILVSLLLVFLFTHEIGGWRFGWGDGVALGGLLAVSGVLGDLVESMLKRGAEVKDSGHWLKGMGGILDVLDSLVFALPMLYLYLVAVGGAAS